ncbi:hypothetical protein D1610_06165 [Sphingomonas gilva]|uniref:DUF1440 domain-containing protein n=1 Tax=Sphingomonas gilva TaxID=2305907 RepID=A0A396RNJ7_9SPHN|nr:hypothetical protein [Sphingomonas gilva]RHW18077.1 hypothetical protein D1610_06165 [Sphingomonas gilva]
MKTARTILLATLVAGTLDILAAIIQGLTNGAAPAAVLRSVAAGPLGDGALAGGAGMAAAGLLIHFAIMAVIVAVFVLAAERIPALVRRPLFWGPLYGLAVWAVMYLIVLPLRWPGSFPLTDPARIAWAIAFHTLLVGLPIALIAAGGRRKSALAS